jgi:aminoglycoside phosphotransferase
MLEPGYRRHVIGSMPIVDLTRCRRNSRQPLPEFEAVGLASPTSAAEALMPALGTGGVSILDVRGCVLRREAPPLARYLLAARLGDAPLEIGVIGKGRRRRSSPGDLDRAFELMRVLWQDCFREDRMLTIAEPLAMARDPATLLQAEIEGETLERWLDDPLPAVAAARQAARWLVKLHSVTFGALPQMAAVDEAAKLHACAERIRAFCPQHSAWVDGVTQRVIGVLTVLEAEPAVLTHGDFQAGNIIVAGDRLAVIDFDHAALAPPARDLGYFTAQALTRMYVRTASTTTGCPWAAALCEEYESHRPGGTRGVAAYVARTILEVLVYRLGKSPRTAIALVPVWLDWCGRTVAIAEREL